MVEKVSKAGGVSDESVYTRTNKHWYEWFTLIDEAGGLEMDHKEIVAFLREGFDLNSWWQQMVTVAYEQARGKRKIHEQGGAFQISASKTIQVPVNVLYAAWEDKQQRQMWLHDGAFEISKATPLKSMRALWQDGETRLSINFYSKGKQKSQVTINHDKIPDSETADKMKIYWRESLENLKQILLNKK